MPPGPVLAPRRRARASPSSARRSRPGPSSARRPHAGSALPAPSSSPARRPRPRLPGAPNLILGIDFTKSNEWSGGHSFGRKSLHAINGNPNPYEQAISIIGRTLSPFDDDNLIPCFGFGDGTMERIREYLRRDKKEKKTSKGHMSR